MEPLSERSVPFYANLDIEAHNNMGMHNDVFIDAANGMQLTLSSIPQGKEIPTEVHDVAQFIRVEDGIGIATVDGRQYALVYGIAMIIPAGSSHRIESTVGNLKLSSIYMGVIANTSDKTDLEIRLERLLGFPIEEWHKLKKIELGRAGLTSLPDAVRRWTSAEEISLYGNKLASLPNGVRGWTSAKVIYLSNNQLTSLPNGVEGWTSAERIELNDNELTSLPDGVKGWVLAKEIDLDRNQLTSLPDGVRGWTSVERLLLSDNQLTSLPDGVRGWISAKGIRLRGNELTFLPDGAREWSSLNSLSLPNGAPVPLQFIDRGVKIVGGDKTKTYSLSGNLTKAAAR